MRGLEMDALLPPNRHRALIVVSLLIGLICLTQVSLAAASRLPSLGLAATRVGDRLIVTWVELNGIAWDAGIQPGDVVDRIDGYPVTVGSDPAMLTRATTVSVTHRDGNRASASIDQRDTIPRARRAAFVAIAGCFFLIAGVVFVLASDTLAAVCILTLATIASITFIAGIATYSGTAWALSIEMIALVAFGTSTFVTFLAFPINHLASRAGQTAAILSVGVGSVLVAAYLWVLARDSMAFAVVKELVFIVLAADLLAATGLAVANVARSSQQERSARSAMGLVALGMIVGLAPFCLLSLVPNVLGIGYIVNPDVAILSVVLLPVTLGAAVLRRQFLGITRLMRRGLIALMVWIALLASYSVGFNGLHHLLVVRSQLFATILNMTILDVAVVAATFPTLQRMLRRLLERTLFLDVYDYAATLRDLGTEIAHLASVDKIAEHTLIRLGATLDLSWAAIGLTDGVTPDAVYRWGECPDRIDELLADQHHGAIRTKDTPPGERSWSFTTDAQTLDYWRPSIGFVDAIGSALLVPLVAEGRPIGTIVIGPKQHDVDLLPEDCSLVISLAPLLAAAIQNALLIHRLEEQVAVLGEREKALAALGEQLYRAQEDERRRLALEIHDDPLQRAILLTRELKSGPGDARTGHVREEVEEITESLRAICSGLRPPRLDALGLAGGLEWLAMNVSSRSDLVVTANVGTTDGCPFGRLDPDLEAALYRVAQEALNNCLKHAHATHGTVTLWRDQSQIRLWVSDDGYAIDDKQADDCDSLKLGYLGLHERLRPWNGVVTVESHPGGGRVVCATIALGGNANGEQ